MAQNDGVEIVPFFGDVSCVGLASVFIDRSRFDNVKQLFGIHVAAIAAFHLVDVHRLRAS